MEDLPESKLTGLDKIKGYLLEDRPIDPKSAEMLKRYRAAFALMAEEKSPSHTIQLIRKKYDLSYPQACKTVRDTIRLFGDVYNYSRVGLKQLMFERLMNMADEARACEDFKAVEKLLHRANMVMDLYNPLTQDKDVGKIFNITINRTTDPEALKTKTIDVDHDTITDGNRGADR